MTDNSLRFSELVAQVATAYFANSHVAVSDIPAVMLNIASGLMVEGVPQAAVREPEPAPTLTPEPAPAPHPKVTAAVDEPDPAPHRPATAAQTRASIHHEFLVSFEDGKPYKILKPHLRLRGLTPEQYREKWGLPKGYPMTAPSHSALRAAIARRSGFGGSNVTRGRPRKR